MSLAAKTRLLGKILEILDRREKAQVAGLLVLMVVGATLEVVGIGIVTSFIGILANPQFIREHRALSSLYDWLGATSAGEFLAYAGAILILVFVTKNAYLGFLHYAQTSFAYAKEVTLSRQLLLAYLDKPYHFHLQRNSADLVKNVTVEVSHVVTGVLMPALTLLTEGTVLIFVLVLLATVEPVIAVTILALLGAVALGFVESVKSLLRKAGSERSASAGQRIKWVNQALGSIKETKLLGREGFFVDRFLTTSRTYARSGLIASTLHSLPRLIIEVVAVTAILAAFLIAQHQGRNLQDMLPLLVLFSLAAMRLMPSISRMTPAFNQLRYWFPALEIVHHDVREAAEPGGNGDTVAREEPRPSGGALRNGILLQDLSYRYPGVAYWAVRNVSLAIPRGRSVAFMGASGAGKSTLVDLVLGLLEAEQGEIRVDGALLTEMRESWQRNIGFVPQSVYLTDDSIAANIALGVPEDRIDHDRIWSVLRSSRLESMVRTLPKTILTEVGERGIKLSGGERQRIGIARALYYDPDVLVFDEATSALDGKTEQEVADTIRGLRGEKTILIVAHRVTTVRNCDQIFFLAQGQLADAGSFVELMERNAEFRSMVGDWQNPPGTHGRADYPSDREPRAEAPQRHGGASA